MGRPVSLLYFFVRGIYYLLDKLVPLTVENDCQAFDFHYGAKKGQRRCEVGVKAFSVQSAQEGVCILGLIWEKSTKF